MSTYALLMFAIVSLWSVCCMALIGFLGALFVNCLPPSRERLSLIKILMSPLKELVPRRPTRTPLIPVARLLPHEWPDLAVRVRNRPRSKTSQYGALHELWTPRQPVSTLTTKGIQIYKN